MNLFFDSIIVLYLVATLVFAVATFRDRKISGKWESRHPKLVVSCSVVLLFSFLVVIWGSFVEPRLITLNSVQIDLPNFAPTKPVRVALISDVHVGTYKKGGWVSRVSARIAQENPDFVFIAGDLIVNKSEHAQYLSNFQFLVSNFPTFAVLGDHDYRVKRRPFSIDEETAQTVDDILTRAGVNVLRNETRTLEKYGAAFTLVGLDDWLAGKTNMEVALSQLSNDQIVKSSNSPIITLVHNPDFILDPQSKNADLILSGNTHGGQIRLPLIGPVPRLPSKLPRSFDEGLFELSSHPSLILPSGRGGKPVSPPLGGGDSEGVQPRQLFITSGISESGPRARLFNPPEIVLLELQ